MKTENNIHIYPDVPALSEAAARLIIGIINKTILQQGRCTIALSGGHTPNSVYAVLATPPFRDEIDWQKVFFFWSDERCVPSNNPQNNFFVAKEILLDKVSVPEENIHCANSEMSPEIAADLYEKTIREHFGEWQPRFDLILLGLGENGHTASLFPGDDQALNSIRIVVDVFVPAQEMHRITMTPYLINNATHVIFLVTGPGKAAVLNSTLSGPENLEQIPAQAIHPSEGNLYWLVDKEAALLLPKQTTYEH